jgi:hypothetical protein
VPSKRNQTYVDPDLCVTVESLFDTSFKVIGDWERHDVTRGERLVRSIDQVMRDAHERLPKVLEEIE